MQAYHLQDGKLVTPQLLKVQTEMLSRMREARRPSAPPGAPCFLPPTALQPPPWSLAPLGAPQTMLRRPWLTAAGCGRAGQAIAELPDLPDSPGCGWLDTEPACDFGCKAGELCVNAKQKPKAE